MNLRIGCPSGNFDGNNTLVDFQFLDSNNEIIANGRILPGYLFHGNVSEIRFLMNRLTPLTSSNLGGISFKHNDQNEGSVVFFYGILITDFKKKEKPIYFPLNTYIKYKSSRKTLLPAVRNSKFEIASNLKPKTPLLRVPHLDLFFIVLFIFYYIAISCLYFPHFDRYMTRTYQIVLAIFGAIVLCPILMLFLVFLDIHVIRRREFIDLMVYGKINSEWTWILYCYFGVLCLFSFFILILVESV